MKSAHAENIVIGINADMSSIAAVSGHSIYRGVQIAVNEINAKGGVLGKPLMVDVKDHRGNPRRGLDNTNTLAENENVIAVVGGIHTPVVLNELKAIHDHHLVYLLPWAAGTSLIDNGYDPNYVFRLSIRDEYAAGVLMQHAKEKGIKNVGLLLERTGWGKSNHQSLMDSTKTSGVSVTNVEWFNWGSRDFTRQIKNFEDAGAEAIIYVGNSPEGAAFTKHIANKAGSRPAIISHWGIASGHFVKEVGLENLGKVDISVLQTYSFLTPANSSKADYVFNQYKALFKNDATVENIPAVTGVVQAYDLVHILATAIEKTQSTDRKLVRNSLENIQNYDGLIRFFDRPFSSDKHDALDAKDYIISTFNERGFLVPVNI